MGVYQGRVTRIESDTIWAEIGDLAVDQEFPCRWVGTGLVVNDRVLVVNLNGAQEDLVIVGKMQSSSTVVTPGDVDGGTITESGSGNDIDGGSI